LLTAIGIGAVVTMSVSAWQVVGSRSRVAASTSAPSALAEPPRRVLNTTGIVNGDYLVAVLTGHPSQTSYATAAARVTELVAALLPAISER
jgi:hypothetical protein